jgi:hypothetical protein
MSCEKCDYWKKEIDGSTRGYCHRDPPTVVGVDPKISTVFPMTRNIDWCGEETRHGKLKFTQWYQTEDDNGEDNE